MNPEELLVSQISMLEASIAIRNVGLRGCQNCGFVSDVELLKKRDEEQALIRDYEAALEKLRK